jgi:hypothetical protein
MMMLETPSNGERWSELRDEIRKARCSENKTVPLGVYSKTIESAVINVADKQIVLVAQAQPRRIHKH